LLFAVVAISTFAFNRPVSGATISIYVQEAVPHFSRVVADIHKGDTVTWVWGDSFSHSVVSGDGDTATPDGLFASGIHKAPFSYSVTFQEVGSFPYYCGVHRSLNDSGNWPVINVNAGSTPRLETESLTVKAKFNAMHTILSDPNLSGDAGTLLSQTAVGSFVSYVVPVPAPGTYNVKVRIKTGPKRGKFQLAIRGVKQGPVQDAYTALVRYQLRDLGQVRFLEGGNKPFRFTVTGKNASAVGTTLALDAIDLIPQ
jgi:plastocyanin